MRILVVTALLVSSFSLAAWAQVYGGDISIYSDSLFTDRTAQDISPGTLTLFVVHDGINAQPAISCQFKIETSAGFTGAWIGETSPFLTVGSSPTGVSIGYDGCNVLPALILVVSYSIAGTSNDCSFLQPGPHPASPTGAIEIAGCLDLAFGVGQKLIINPDDSCNPVGIRDSTWGRVKALFETAR